LIKKQAKMKRSAIREFKSKDVELHKQKPKKIDQPAPLPETQISLHKRVIHSSLIKVH